MKTFRSVFVIILLITLAKLTFGSKTDTIQNTSKNDQVLFETLVIYYHSGSDIPDENTLEKIISKAIKFKSNPSITYSILGYTDPEGSEEFNQKLSESRAEKVKEYLIKNGIPATRIMITGYGESKSQNIEQEVYPKMRKVEIKPIILMK